MGDSVETALVAILMRDDSGLGSDVVMELMKSCIMDCGFILNLDPVGFADRL